MMKRGFTIVELLVSIGILTVLMGLVVTAASSSLQAAREKRATALCHAVQTGLATYHAQRGEWPGTFGSKVKSGSLSQSNQEGVNNTDDSDKYVLSAEEVRALVKALVDETKQGNPMMDISGLFVSRDSGESGHAGLGMDFMTAVHGSKLSRKKMTTAEMYFGYPESSSGYFRRFKMVYSIPTDVVRVMKQGDN